MKALQIEEHNYLPATINTESLLVKYKKGFCLNPYESNSFHRKYFFSWDTFGKEEGYKATYVIGAQHIDVGEISQPLVVTPKIQDIDFLRMFDVCLKYETDYQSFAKIYNVDMAQPAIETTAFRSVLSPLIIVHYLSIVCRIVKKGLRKNYVRYEENLKKVRGRIGMMRNERLNVMNRRFDRVYCNYQEYSIDTSENRLLKKALLFSKQVLSNPLMPRSVDGIKLKLNQCLSAFENVSDEVDYRVVMTLKVNKLYKEYNDAIVLANTILRRYDYNINNTSVKETKTPVFWIDMALLYEHYVKGLLLEAYGENMIEYQADCYSGKPDFVCKTPKIVMDAKYIPRFENERIDADIVAQLSGYARDEKLFDGEEIVPCIIIYPHQGNLTNPFQGKDISSFIEIKTKVKGLVKFYKVGVALPEIG